MSDFTGGTGFVHNDLIEGGTITEDDRGFSATRIFIVEDFLEGDQKQRIANVLKHNDIPKLKDQYPGETTTPIYCTSRTAEPIGPSQYRVTCQYSSAQAGQPKWKYSMNGSTVQRNVSEDVTGALLPKLKPTQKSSDGKRDFAIECPAIQPLIGKIQPQPVFSATARLPVTTFYPELGLIFVGKVNSSPIHAFGDNNTGMLLCTRISADQVDDQFWDVTIEWQYDANEWKGAAVYIDPQTRMPIENASTENGSKITADLYDSIDFNEFLQSLNTV